MIGRITRSSAAASTEAAVGVLGDLLQRAVRRRHELHLPALPALQGLGRVPPGGLHGLGRVRVGLLPVGHPRDEERGVVAPRGRLRGDPARPRPQQVGAEDESRPARARRRACGAARRGRPAAAQWPRAAARSGEQHPALLERLPHGGGDERAGQLGVAAEPLAPPARVGAGPTRRRRAGRRGRRPRRGRRSSRRRTPSRRPGAAGRPAAGCVRAEGSGGRAPAARSPPAGERRARRALPDTNPPARAGWRAWIGCGWAWSAVVRGRGRCTGRASRRTPAPRWPGCGRAAPRWRRSSRPSSAPARSPTSTTSSPTSTRSRSPFRRTCRARSRCALPPRANT